MKRQDLTVSVLDTETFGSIDLSPITHDFGDCRSFGHTPGDECFERIAGAHVVVTNKVQITRELLEAHRPKLVCVTATGTNNVDLEAATELGIPVTNVPGYSTPSVVSHTLAMYFHVAHNSAYYEDYYRRGRWCASNVFTHLGMPFSELEGKTWGIIGMGAIGRGVARVVEAFGCSVVYHSPSGKNLKQNWPHLTLDELLGRCDVISIHTPLTPITRELISYDQMLLMKKNAILINTSRGGIVDEDYLSQFLDAGDIAGAALDVLETEPPEVDNPLWRMDHPERLFLTPHIAGLSIEARQRLVTEVGLNIDAFLSGTPRNLVS